jgi:hypothetical protein
VSHARVLVTLRCLVGLCGGLFACSSKDYYTSDHAGEIRYDCTQAVGCAQTSGTTVDSSEVDKCIKASSALLDKSSDAQRAVFEQTVARCGRMQNCAYMACTKLDDSYSRAHQLDIQFDCQQNVSCRLQNGEMLAASATSDCVLQISQMLDAATDAQRTAFETHLNNCRMQTSCGYVSCK